MIVDCVLQPLKEIEGSGISIYWYKARDRSGECVLTSHRRIELRKARMLSVSKKTVSGNPYLEFLKLV